MTFARILIFTATFDEAANIQSWLTRVKSSVPKADVLVIDDSSPDGTSDIVKKFAATDQSVTLITRSGKLGLGSAHKDAFQYAREHGYDALVTMDADLSHDPEQTPSLLAALDDADFVIGSRWGEGTCEYRGYRRFVSWSGNFLARLLLRAPVTEYTTSYRAFNTTALLALEANEPDDDGYAFFMEVVTTLHRAKVRMSEVPITFRDRAGGTSKIPKSQIAVSCLRLAQIAMKQR